MMLRTTIRSIFLFVAVASSLGLRELEPWPIDRLMRESDLVVIASVHSSMENQVRPDGVFGSLAVVGRTTVFDVKAAIKGQAGPSIELMHFDLPANAMMK